MPNTYENNAEPKQPSAPTDPPEKGSEKYGSTRLLLSSADRGWSGLSAELWNFSRGEIPWRSPKAATQLCVDVRGNRALVTRRAAGIEDRRVASRGTIWLSPPGRQEGSVEIAEDVRGILHIYLPLSRFSPSNLGANIDESVFGVLSYERASWTDGAKGS